MKRMALVILLVLMVALMIPLFAQAHCSIQDNPVPAEQVHCGGTTDPPSGFIGVDLGDGNCVWVSDQTDPPVNNNCSFPTHP